ncbi:MAG: hypothetical protein MUF55_08975 [Hydrogenophaga sp.]|jgi:hypothetical protein|nr:hypothetical protein [Hydrogenophaga sp.]
MKDTDIELIMAHADGQLPPEQRGHVQALLDSDAEARELLARFRETGALLDPVARELLSEPVPQRLLDTVRQHPMAGEAAAALTPMPAPLPVATPVHVTTPERSPANDTRFWPRWAAAASVALAVGLVAGHWWGSQGADTGQTLAQVLQTTPSGTSVALADGSALPLATFRRADGQPCREFEQVAGGRLSHGIACRTDGIWVTQLLIDRGPDQGQIGQAPAFVPASGQADALAAMVESLGLDEALGAAEEDRLIRQGWSDRP